ncbi:MAG: hypothetical protein EOO49_12125 [Flavobacterium sp.]|nr:MAG: hypothetical protein EOO49_12125 [Flavobacterium sp.]
MKLVSRLKVFLLILAIGNTSCHLVPCGWNADYDIVIQKPLPGKVEGKYVLSQKSQEFLKFDFSRWPKYLHLSQTGKYTFFNNPKQPSKQGNWRLYCDGKSNCKMELEGITVEDLGEKDSDIAVLVTIGDPDSCEGIAYEKVN